MSTPIVDLVLAGGILYFIWLFHQLIQKTIVIHAAKEKYLALYELKVVENELKERNLSFEDLDVFGNQFVQSEKQSRVKKIDQEYDIDSNNKSKKETKK